MNGLDKIMVMLEVVQAEIRDMKVKLTLIFMVSFVGMILSFACLWELLR